MITPLPAASPSAFTTMGNPLLADELDGGEYFGEFSVSGRRDAVPGHEVLCKGLGPFQLRRRALGPKQARPASLNRSTMPLTSGSSGPVMVRSDTLFTGKSEQAIQVIDRDGNVFHAGFTRRTRVAGRYEYFFDAGRFCCSPGECVFAAAAAYY